MGFATVGGFEPEICVGGFSIYVFPNMEQFRYCFRLGPVSGSEISSNYNGGWCLTTVGGGLNRRFVLGFSYICAP